MMDSALKMADFVFKMIIGLPKGNDFLKLDGEKPGIEGKKVCSDGNVIWTGTYCGEKTTT